MPPKYFQDFGTVGEKVSLNLEGTIVNHLGAAIPGGSLTTCTLTIYDVGTGTVVSGFDDLDIKASVDSQGVLSHKIPMAGVTIVGVGAGPERKVALVEFTYNAGVDGGFFEYRFAVYNQVKRS